MLFRSEFHFTDGYLVPASVAGSVGRVAILGKGRFTFTAPNRVERQQLTKYTRQADGPFIENFSQLVLLLSDEGYRDLIKNVSLKRVKNDRIFKPCVPTSLFSPRCHFSRRVLCSSVATVGVLKHLGSRCQLRIYIRLEYSRIAALTTKRILRLALTSIILKKPGYQRAEGLTLAMY